MEERRRLLNIQNTIAAGLFEKPDPSQSSTKNDSIARAIWK